MRSSRKRVSDSMNKKRKRQQEEEDNDDNKDNNEETTDDEESVSGFKEIGKDPMECKSTWPEALKDYWKTCVDVSGLLSATEGRYLLGT